MKPRLEVAPLTLEDWLIFCRTDTDHAEQWLTRGAYLAEARMQDRRDAALMWTIAQVPGAARRRFMLWLCIGNDLNIQDIATQVLALRDSDYDIALVDLT